MTSLQKTYREILDGNYGRDVEFIANVIATSCSKPVTKLRGLLRRVRNGVEVRCGNSTDSIRINGEYHFGLTVLES